MSDITESTRWHDTTAAISCIAVLILALMIGYFREVGNFEVETDFYGAYARQAERIMAGRLHTYTHNTPGYMYLLAGASLLTGNVFTAAKILSAFAAALLGWITYLLLKALFDSRIALGSTILLVLAIFPYSFLAATDLLGALTVLLPLWVLLRRPMVTSNACFLAGILAGVAYLARSPAIFVIVGTGLSLLFINPDRQTSRKCAARTTIFFCGALLVTSPYLATNWQSYGNPFYSTAYIQIAAHFFHPQGDAFGTSLQQESEHVDSLSDVLSRDPKKLVVRYTKDVLYHNAKRLATEGIQFPAYLFAGGGVLLLLGNLCRRRVIFIGVCLLGYFTLNLVGFYIRYYLFIFPLLYLSVAYCLFHEDTVGRFRGIPFAKGAISWVIISILFVCSGIEAFYATRRIIVSEPRYLVEIAEILRGRSKLDDIIISRKPHLSYLAGLRGALPLVDTADGYLEKARELGARYIVYSDYEASLWPGLKSLRDPDTLPSSFKCIYRNKETNTLVYEIVDVGGNNGGRGRTEKRMERSGDC